MKVVAKESCDLQEWSDILDRMSRHLSTLLNEITAIEDALGEVWKLDHVQPVPAVEQIQKIDFVRQALSDLVLLTDLLASTESSAALDRSVTASISQRLSLDVTRFVAQGVCKECNFSPNGAESGRVDLF